MLAIKPKERIYEILDEVDRLNKLHPKEQDVRRKCEPQKCEICSQLQRLGKEYEKIIGEERKKRRIKNSGIYSIEEVIAKGTSVTKKELQYLVEVKQFTKREASKLLGFSYSEFLTICRDLKIGTIRE